MRPTLILAAAIAALVCESHGGHAVAPIFVVDDGTAFESLPEAVRPVGDGEIALWPTTDGTTFTFWAATRRPGLYSTNLVDPLQVVAHSDAAIPLVNVDGRYDAFPGPFHSTNAGGSMVVVPGSIGGGPLGSVHLTTDGGLFEAARVNGELAGFAGSRVFTVGSGMRVDDSAVFPVVYQDQAGTAPPAALVKVSTSGTTEVLVRWGEPLPGLEVGLPPVGFFWTSAQPIFDIDGDDVAITDGPRNAFARIDGVWHELGRIGGSGNDRKPIQLANGRVFTQTVVQTGLQMWTPDGGTSTLVGLGSTLPNGDTPQGLARAPMLNPFGSSLYVVDGDTVVFVATDAIDGEVLYALVVAAGRVTFRLPVSELTFNGLSMLEIEFGPGALANGVLAFQGAFGSHNDFGRGYFALRVPGPATLAAIGLPLLLRTWRRG